MDKTKNNNKIDLVKNLDEAKFNKSYNKILNNNSRIIFMDWLRIISSFFIILIHLTAVYFYKFPIKSYKWKIIYFYNGLSRFGLPIFFMISGALFLKRDLSLKNIFNKYIKRIFIHLLLWSIIYSITKNKLMKSYIKKIIFEIIKGHYHLWYLYATIGLYINIPFSREITKNERLLKYFIILYFIIIFIIPNSMNIISYYSKDIYYLFKNINSKLNLNNFSINTFYFIFGYYLDNKKYIKKIIRIIIYILGGIGFFITTIISYNISIKNNKKLNLFNLYYLNIFFASTSVFIFFKNNFNNLNIIIKRNNIIQIIAKYTFGIYLIHPLIIEKIIKKLNFKFLTKNILFLIPIVNFIIFILSLIITIILKYIPLIGKYLT